jgi:hypothetical protein
LSQELIDLGVTAENIIVWEKNGIEYVYPAALIATSFNCALENIHTMKIVDDLVSIGEASFKKNELKSEILRRLDASTELPEELERKLLSKVRATIE